MAENRRGKDKRFYFSRLQLVQLGGAFTIASIIIFFLGIFVGKGIEERKLMKSEEPLVKIPVTPSAQQGPADEKLTFYDTLTKSPAAKTPDDGKPTVAEKPVKVAKAEDHAGAQEAKISDPPASTKTAPQATTSKPNESDAKSAKGSEPTARDDNGATWTVQVNAFPDERSANIWVDRLKNKGYKAYVTEVRNRGKIWYRVRVGKFNSREAAAKVMDALKTKENFANAFATSQ